MTEGTWEDYYARTKDCPPSSALQRALTLIQETSKTALDLGCGSGNATRALLDQGFWVTAVDRHPAALDHVHRLPKVRLRIVQSDFETFAFQRYHLIYAQHSLPFLSPGTFKAVWERIEEALLPGGVFVGSFFGIHDEWYKTCRRHMTFLEREHLEMMLGRWSLLSLVEQERDARTALGTMKYWHTFQIIAQNVYHDEQMDG